MATVFDVYIANAIAALEQIDLLPIGQDPGGTEADGAIAYSDLIDQIISTHTDYKITPSLSGSNLVLTLTHSDDSAISSTKPLWVKIGDTWHKITSALSVTAAAATNWCNAGAAETAALEIGLFTYLGYNATDGVVIGFSRIPNATKYSDFSATPANEKFCKISVITTAGASDVYENIGYFHAILSAGGGYTWTLPGTSVIYSRPKRESNIVSWQPTIVGYSADPTDDTYQYKVKEDGTVECVLSEQTNGTGDTTARTYTLPFTSSTLAFSLSSYPIDNGGALTEPGSTRVTAASNVWEFANASNFTGWTASGNSRMRGATITILL